MSRALHQSALAAAAAAFLIMSVSACGGNEKDSAKTGKVAAAKEDQPAKGKAHRKPAADRKAGAGDAESRGVPKAAPGKEDGPDPAKGVVAPPPGFVPNPAGQVAPSQAVAAPAAGAPAGSAAQAARQPEPGAPKTDISRPPLADPRLLLTMVDVSKIAPARARFRRAALAGLPRTEDSDSIMYAPEKGDAFGFSLQLFRTRNAQETKKRFEALQASYPNSQEISSVSGKTFFSYWDEVMHITFVHPGKNMVVVVSCGRSFCDSNQLMELSGTISERLK